MRPAPATPWSAASCAPRPSALGGCWPSSCPTRTGAAGTATASPRARPSCAAACAATSPAPTSSRRPSTPSTATPRPPRPPTGGRSWPSTTSCWRPPRARWWPSTAPSRWPRSRARRPPLPWWTASTWTAGTCSTPSGPICCAASAATVRPPWPTTPPSPGPRTRPSWPSLRAAAGPWPGPRSARDWSMHRYDGPPGPGCWTGPTDRPWRHHARPRPGEAPARPGLPGPRRVRRVGRRLWRSGDGHHRRVGHHRRRRPGVRRRGRAQGVGRRARPVRPARGRQGGDAGRPPEGQGQPDRPQGQRRDPVGHPGGRAGRGHRRLPDHHQRGRRRQPARGPAVDRQRPEADRHRLDGAGGPDRPGLRLTTASPGPAGRLQRRARVWFNRCTMTAGLLERDAELRRLRVTLRGAAKGRGSVVLVSGEAGIGKTSLVRAFAREAAGRARVLAGACDDLVTPRTLGPFRDMAREAAPALARAMEPGAARDAVFGAVHQELAGGPVVLLVEDVHWADDATLDVLRYLAWRIPELPAVLVLTYREDELGGQHPLRRVLAALPHGEVRRLHLRPLSAGAVAELAGGHGADAAAVLAATVRDAVLARLEGLSEPTRQALELLATVPGQVERWLAEELLGGQVTALDEAERRGMLEADPSAVWFRHELARRAIERQLSSTARVACNRRVLAARAGHPDGELSRLSHHAHRAGDPEAVLHHGLAAAREAAGAGAFSEAWPTTSWCWPGRAGCRPPSGRPCSRRASGSSTTCPASRRRWPGPGRWSACGNGPATRAASGRPSPPCRGCATWSTTRPGRRRP